MPACSPKFGHSKAAGEGGEEKRGKERKRAECAPVKHEIANSVAQSTRCGTAMVALMVALVAAAVVWTMRCGTTMVALAEASKERWAT